MINWGAKFVWYFTYMPVGKVAVPELMATAEQREFMYRQVRGMRGKKPIFFMDFWNDGEYVGGCIAGGRCFLHINAAGDIEPCAFIHYSDANIRTDKLIDAYRKPLFMAYHNNQPFNSNMLRPCPALDNPDALTKMVDESEPEAQICSLPKAPANSAAGAGKKLKSGHLWPKKFGPAVRPVQPLSDPRLSLTQKNKTYDYEKSSRPKGRELFILSDF
jgi:hypothetical protein